MPQFTRPLRPYKDIPDEIEPLPDTDRCLEECPLCGRPADGGLCILCREDEEEGGEL